MKIDVLTIFPEFFTGVFDFGIIRRARLAEIVDIGVHDLRDWTTDKHRKVDDRPFGGGDGMVLKPEPVFAAVEDLVGTCQRDQFPSGTRVVLLTPQGELLKQVIASDLAGVDHLILICGRYEGVDERVSRALVTDEISIGDYVISGGEPAAVILTDAVVRLLPGALGSRTSAENDSFSNGIFDFPHYTQPREYRGLEVPEILLSGNHVEIEKWRKRKAIEKTKSIRKDLIEGAKGDENSEPGGNR